VYKNERRFISENKYILLTRATYHGLLSTFHCVEVRPLPGERFPFQVKPSSTLTKPEGALLLLLLGAHVYIILLQKGVCAAQCKGSRDPGAEPHAERKS